MNTKIFLDNKIITANPSLLRNLTPGIMRAKGVFETMRVYAGKVFLLDKHVHRLFRGLDLLEIPRASSGCSMKNIKEHIENILHIHRLKNARIRLTAWKENRRLRIAVAAFRYQPYSAYRYQKGFKAVISGIRRNPAASGLNIKSLDYHRYFKAYQEAQRRGYDEAVLLNKKGQLVEGSRTNIFFVVRGNLFTPSLKCGCLNGITRQAVIKLTGEMGIRCKNVSAVPQDVYAAQEAFLTNSLIEIMPLTALNGKKINNGRAGRLTKKLWQRYKKLTG